MATIDIHKEADQAFLRELGVTAWQAQSREHLGDPVMAADAALEASFEQLLRDHRLPIPGDEVRFDLDWQDEDMAPAEIETPEDAGDQAGALVHAFAQRFLLPLIESFSESREDAQAIRQQVLEQIKVRSDECGKRHCADLCERYELAKDEAVVANLTTSWERFTSESVDAGEVESRGMLSDTPDTYGPDELSRLLEVTEASQSPITTPWSTWYRRFDQGSDMIGDDHTEHSYHPVDDGSAELMADVWRRVNR